MRRLYAWMLRMAAHRRALGVLALVSFAESSFFPIPPDVMIAPMVLARRERAWRIAAVCTVASVAGGLAGYAIGSLLLDTVGMPILAFYGVVEDFHQLARLYDEHGVWVVAVGGLTPVPYKAVTIASGAFRFDLAAFIAASAATRGMRFFAVAGVVWWFGPAVGPLLERWAAPIGWGLLGLIVAGFVAARWLV
ncbi:MAG: YqaA family protein [Alphaproteobacteria bacterium]